MHTAPSQLSSGTSRMPFRTEKDKVVRRSPGSQRLAAVIATVGSTVQHATVTVSPLPSGGGTEVNSRPLRRVFQREPRNSDGATNPASSHTKLFE